MNDLNLSLHLKNFNDKVKVMNQTGSKQLTLSANEARSLHSDIFDLLNHCAHLSKRLESYNSNTNNDVISISVDGGGFK
jgi:hypothetical protein